MSKPDSPSDQNWLQKPFCSGSPIFDDVGLNSLAREQGTLRAWEEAFRRWGAQAPAQIRGDFAVAVVAPGEVFLAVDRFAVRTMCYRVDGDSLRFAERADQLADTTTEIDLQAIFSYFYFHAIPSPQTVFKGIFRVPPGHAVRFRNGVATVAPYWIPAFDVERRVDFGSLRDEFRALLKQAVGRQLDGSKPACFLSGGTDSSTVTGMVGEVSGSAPATYSIGFAAEGYDEMAFARIAARHFGADHHEYYVTPDDLVSSIPKVAAYYDQPFGNSSALPAYYCAAMARADGVTRILAGDGGDELFGGNARYAKSRVFGWYRHVPHALSNGLLEPVLASGIARRFTLGRKGASYVEQAREPMPDRLQMYNLICRLGISGLMTPEFLSNVARDVPLLLQRQVWNAAQADVDLNRELAFDWRFTLAESDLPKVCGTTQLAGLAVGFPMLDDDLLAFSMRLPVNYKLKGLKLRWFFKEALRGFLPDEILVKKKQGFGLPFGVWLTRHGALRKLATESVYGLVDRGLLQRRFVDDLVGKLLLNHPGYYGEMIWISMMLEQWLRARVPTYSIR